MPMTFTYAGGSANLISLDATFSIGISPGLITLETGPADAAPAKVGDVAITDGETVLTFRDCRIDNNGFQAVYAAGQAPYWMIRLLDRRWRWRRGYALSGHYNQRDDHNKLIPVTARSPHQLATILLEEMGEEGYEIDLKGGLAVPTYYMIRGVYSDEASYSVTVNGVTFTAFGNDSDDMAGVLGDLAAQISESEEVAVKGKATASVAEGKWLAVQRVNESDGLTMGSSSTNLPADSKWEVKAIEPGPGDVIVSPTTEFLGVGVNTTNTNTNTTVSWTATPAAVALAALCDQHGRVVVYDPITDKVSVQVLGEGGDSLPEGPLVSTSPSIDPKEVPKRVTVLGAPNRYQLRMVFAEVGKDWDGAYRRPADLSYAPERQEQTMQAAWSGMFVGGATYTLTINSAEFEVSAADHDDMGGITEDFRDQINDSTEPDVQGKVTAIASGGVLVVEGVEPGYEFAVPWFPKVAADRGNWQVRCVRGPVPVVPKPQSMVATFTGTFAEDDEATWSAEGVDAQAVWSLRINDVLFFVEIEDVETMADVVENLADQINVSTDPKVAGKVTAEADGESLVITSEEDAGPFDVNTDGTVLFAPASWKVAVTVPAYTEEGGNGFEYARHGTPLSFNGAVATDRLTYQQAKRLADSIYRFYQLRMVHPYDMSPGLPWPSVGGRVTRSSRVVLQDSRPEQMAPRAPDAARIDPETLLPFAAEVYDGYAKDRPPAAFGSISGDVSQPATWGVADANVFNCTPPNGQIFVPFNIVDKLRNIVEFAEPIYRQLGDTYQPPDKLVIETGALLLDAATNAPIRFSYSVDIPGGEGPEYVLLREDVQQEIIGDYTDDHQQAGYRVQDDYAESAAAYYANNALKWFVTSSAITNTYGGLRLISLSGQVRQVTWTFNRGGPFTTASAGTEHSPSVLQFNARRFNENIPADPFQVAINAETQRRAASKAPNNPRG